MGETMYGICDSCRKSATLNRFTERFSFPCECHSPKHTIIHDLCDECYQTFKENPNRYYNVNVSPDTFATFLKAQAHYYAKDPEKRKLGLNELNPKYTINDYGKPIIMLVCTYATMCYLSTIYTGYLHWKETHEGKEEK